MPGGHPIPRLPYLGSLEIPTHATILSLRMTERLEIQRGHGLSPKPHRESVLVPIPIVLQLTLLQLVSYPHVTTLHTLRIKQSTEHFLQLHWLCRGFLVCHCNHTTWQEQPKQKGLLWLVVQVHRGGGGRLCGSFLAAGVWQWLFRSW